MSLPRSTHEEPAVSRISQGGHETPITTGVDGRTAVLFCLIVAVLAKLREWTLEHRSVAWKRVGTFGSRKELPPETRKNSRRGNYVTGEVSVSVRSTQVALI